MAQDSILKGKTRHMADQQFNPTIRAIQILQENFSFDFQKAQDITQVLYEENLLVTKEVAEVLKCAFEIRQGPTGGPYTLAAAIDKLQLTGWW